MPRNVKPSKKLIYLDYAATTPVREEVLRVMRPFWGEKFGNPSSLYKLGVEAKLVVENARKSVAENLGARPEEVIFTAGGSESVSLAILGTARAHTLNPTGPFSHRVRDKLYIKRRNKNKGHIITSKIEHSAVLAAVDQLEQEGFSVTRIGVDKEGFFDLDEFKKMIRPDTILVSLMYANNEIGTIEPIRQISKIIREENLRRSKVQTSNFRLPIFFHTDACQAAGFLDINVQRLGVNLLSLNASKIYGPKQVGVLFVRKGTNLQPIVFGGGQERALRSGTENVTGIVGFAKALELAQQEKEKENKRLRKLRDYFVKEVLRRVQDTFLNGPTLSIDHDLTFPPTHVLSQKRLSNNINVSFGGAEGEAVMLYLDAYNIAVSTGSACTSGDTNTSHVLRAIGLSDKDARSSIRITLGKFTTRQELDYLLKVLPGVVEMNRRVEKS